MTSSETQAPPSDTPKTPDASKAVQQKTERPPQTEEVLCTICGMRSCWRG